MARAGALAGLAALLLAACGDAEQSETGGTPARALIKTSKGDITDPGQIVAAIERIHKVRRVKVNVVQIGTSPLPFMRRLAGVTEGMYKFFKAGEPKNLPK